MAKLDSPISSNLKRTKRPIDGPGNRKRIKISDRFRALEFNKSKPFHGRSTNGSDLELTRPFRTQKQQLTKTVYLHLLCTHHADRENEIVWL